MFYEPGKTDHGLPHDPFKACVIPRPIGWISSVSASGKHNLAPYSQFNNLTYDPPYVMFSANQNPGNNDDDLIDGSSSSGQRKDTVRNVEATGRFIWNLATWDLRSAVNGSAEMVDREVDEFERVGLKKAYGKIVRDVPMVEDSPVKFECEYHSTLRLPGNAPMGTVDIIIGRVVGIHIKDWAITDGKLDVKKTMPIARCGYYDYAVVRETFEMVIPGKNEALLAGMEGSSKRVKAASSPLDNHALNGKQS